MAKPTKKAKLINEKVDREAVYGVEAAFELLKSLPRANFTESVEVAINLGIDARKSDQNVRGATSLPNGIGKTVRVAVFTQGANVELAKEAGADIVGFDDLAAEVQKGNMDFDVVIASPDAMPVVGRLGQILGPRGLMPNPKVGTVTADVATAVKNAKGGQVRFRNDKGAIVSSSIGTIDFEAPALAENLTALLIALHKAKPSSAKGTYIKKVTVATTQGPGLTVDASGLDLKA